MEWLYLICMEQNKLFQEKKKKNLDDLLYYSCVALKPKSSRYNIIFQSELFSL